MAHCVGSSDVRRNIISFYVCSFSFGADTCSKKNNNDNDSRNNNILLWHLYFATGSLGIQTDEAKTTAVSWFRQCIVLCSFGKLARRSSYPEKTDASPGMHTLNCLPFERHLIYLDNLHARKLYRDP